MNILVSLLLWTSYIVTLYLAIFWMIITLGSIDKSPSSGKRHLKRIPYVAVIIPTFNGAFTIRRTIESVLALDYPRKKLKILIVNDGSLDNTKAVVEDVIRHHPERNIRLLNQHNQGKANALNNGLKHVSQEFFACLDDDSVVDSSALRNMLLVFEDNPDLAIVTPAMKVGSQGNLLQSLQRIEYLISIFLNRLMSRLDAVYVAPGPFSLYRRDVIMHLGGFDTRNLAEDQEIAYRVQEHNLGIRQCSDAYVYTDVPGTLKGFFSQRNRWYKGSLFNLLKYKKLFLNPKYGHFGIFQMPVNMIFALLGGVSVLFFIYFFMVPLFDRFHNLYLVGFDILPFLKTLNFSPDILSLNFSSLFISVTLFLIVLVMTFLAHLNAEERITPFRMVGVFLFISTYYILLSFINLVAFVEMVFGRYQKW